jgi:hypothetical protein
MSKRILFLMTGLSLAVSSAGCCCLGHMGYNRGCNCGCPPQGGGGYYTPQTGMYQTVDPSQLAYTGATSTAYSSSVTTTAAAPGAVMGAPIVVNPGYTTTVMAPTNSLPTY